MKSQRVSERVDAREEVLLVSSGKVLLVSSGEVLLVSSGEVLYQ